MPFVTGSGALPFGRERETERTRARGRERESRAETILGESVPNVYLTCVPNVHLGRQRERVARQD